MSNKAYSFLLIIGLVVLALVQLIAFGILAIGDIDTQYYLPKSVLRIHTIVFHLSWTISLFGDILLIAGLIKRNSVLKTIGVILSFALLIGFFISYGLFPASNYR